MSEVFTSSAQAASLGLRFWVILKALLPTIILP